MDVFTMVCVIVGISVTAGIINNYLKVQGKQRAVQDDPAVQAELAELRERIEVLESIVTDKKYQLARDLDALG